MFFKFVYNFFSVGLLPIGKCFVDKGVSFTVKCLLQDQPRVSLTRHHHTDDVHGETRYEDNTVFILGHWDCVSSRIDIPENQFRHLVTSNIILTGNVFEDGFHTTLEVTTPTVDCGCTVKLHIGDNEDSLG